MSAQIRHILDDANMDDEDIMRIMSIVKKQEEKLQEKSMKLYDLSRENGELREACMKKYVVKIPDDVQKEIDEAYEMKEYVDYLKKENEKLKEKLASIQETIKDVWSEEKTVCSDDSIRRFNWGEKEFWEVLKGLLRGGEGDLRWCQEVKRGLAGV